MFSYSYDFYSNLGKVLVIDNGIAQIKISLDFGPRILSYSLVGGENIFYSDVDRYMTNPSYESKNGRGGEWNIYGGHRFWTSPEDYDFTYDPDNSPYTYDIDRPGGSVELIAPTREYTGLQKTIRVTLDENSARVKAEHFLTNHSSDTYELAIWAVTVMDKGGYEYIPLTDDEPDVIKPNRILNLWNGASYSDDRLGFDGNILTLKQDENCRSSFKLGTRVECGTVGMVTKGCLFTKHFACDQNAIYPDGGCNYESYTNRLLTEMESLSPLYELKPGDTVTHTEYWNLCRNY